MNKKSLTLTIVANMTSNYGETLGIIARVQKVYKNQKIFTIRSKESLKNAIMVQSGMYDDLETESNKATQKKVNENLNAANCRALEAGYMNTTKGTKVRKSSIYLTDAISCESFVNEPRFHNNLYLASNYAKANNLNVQDDAGVSGLTPYQYEYDKSLKVYSMTIDLEMIGKDENFSVESSNDEKAARVNSLLDAVKSLSLVVKGNLDNAEPLFVIGGLSERKTHYFENNIKIKNNKLIITEDLLSKLNEGYDCALLEGNIFDNEDEIKEKLNPKSVINFFDDLKLKVTEYYE